MKLPGEWSFLRPPRGELTLFDFGAISFTVRFPVQTTPGGLLARRQPGRTGPADEAARRLLAAWLERIRPAVYDFAVSDMSEEYIVFQLWEPRVNGLKTTPTGSPASFALSLSRSAATRFVRPLASASRIHQRPRGSRLGGRRGGRPECADTLEIIEFANVQLLEFRHIDDRLDDRLEAAYRLIRPERSRRRLPLRWRLHGDAVRQIRELEIEATSLFERVDNSLKLIGDYYLARVFEVAGARFTSEDGNRASDASSKRSATSTTYWSNKRRSATEALEVTVVILIALEIALALLRH